MTSSCPYIPLAERLRPQSLDDIFGQSHILAINKSLRMVYESGEPHSMIFWGPPGVGKTSLAQLAARYFSAEFISLSAVLSGVKEIKAVIEQAKINLGNGLRTIVFIDEIHRFNKSQQDALLPFTESGLITIIGATTENPSFEVNRALLSRVQLYVLKPLDESALVLLLKRAWSIIPIEQELSTDLVSTMIQLANGDARRLLNILESLAHAIKQVNPAELTLDFIHSILSDQVNAFDKGGDIFYEQISALHKSVRGSNPDAALYWFTRMLNGGVDVAYLIRRIIRMAWEDIGLADPKALQIVNDAAKAYERLGSPEGDLSLASAIIYLSVAPKSNASYKAFNAAKAHIKKDVSREVPLHLRNAPTPSMKSLGYGENYRYPHDESYGYAVGVSYWPENMPPHQWYFPVQRGLEIKISEKLKFLKQLEEHQ